MLEIRARMKEQRPGMENLLMALYERKLTFSEDRYFAMAKKWKRAKTGEKRTTQVIKDCLLATQPGLAERDALHFATICAQKIFAKQADGYQLILRKSKKQQAPKLPQDFSQPVLQHVQF